MEITTRRLTLGPLSEGDRERVIDLFTNDMVKQTYILPDFETREEAIPLFQRVIIGLFAEADPAMEEIGALCIRLQCLALPVHGWVATVNCLCSALGRARGAILLATARQGTCLLPIIPVLALFGAYGMASAQALADMLTLLLAVPLSRKMVRMIREAEAGGGVPLA